MKGRTIFVIIGIIVIIGVFGYEQFIKEEAIAHTVEKGKESKSNTNEFFLPTSTSGQIIHHEGFSLSYSEPHEQAEWVAYELKKSHFSKSNFKRPLFEIDLAVKSGAASWQNYKNSGYDRGHLCPAGDRNYSQQAHDETFLTSNITPQDHQFNSGIWNTLEQKTRSWARKYDGVFVVTGGVLNGDLKTIGTEKVAVPKEFYKIILDNENGHYKMIGFLMPHKNSTEPLSNFVVSIDSIEMLTGIDFFPELEDIVENDLEARSDFREWNF